METTSVNGLVTKAVEIKKLWLDDSIERNMRQMFRSRKYKAADKDDFSAVYKVLALMARDFQDKCLTVYRDELRRKAQARR